MAPDDVGMIEALRTEGHPTGAGTVGDNVTLAASEWSLMVSGTVLLFGGAEVWLPPGVGSGDEACC